MHKAKFKNVILHKYFLAAVVTLYVCQSLFLVLTVAFAPPRYDIGWNRMGIGVAPDEFRHLGNVHYYAERPLGEGPFLFDTPDEALRLGEIERFPGYVYYYLLSIPTKLMKKVELNDTQITYALRASNSALGLGVLFLLLRVLRKVGFDEVVARLALLATSLTGVFVWLSASVNYDMLALALFLVFILSLIKYLKSDTIYNLLLAFMVTIFLGLVKYTYIPICVLAIGVGQYMLFKRKNKLSFKPSAPTKGQKIKLIAVSAGIVLGGALFTERIVQNIYQYGAVHPRCDTIHSYSACQQFGIFRRNENAKKRYEAELSSGDRVLDYRPIEHVGMWLSLNYKTMYHYGSHVKIERVMPVAQILAALLLAVAACFWLRYMNTKALSHEQLLLLVVIGAYVAMVYLFNLQTYLKLGEHYATSGRYMLPIIGFIYAFSFMFMSRVFKTPKSASKFFFGLRRGALAALIVGTMIVHMPIVTFIYHATPRHYSKQVRELLPNWMTKTN